ncbi:MAG TPA: ABC transporter permease subunit [Casimicrobiaceae bacterium]|jgi:ABC-type nitrate/sulfonate/bicarbonate transport system permease component
MAPVVGEGVRVSMARIAAPFDPRLRWMLPLGVLAVLLVTWEAAVRAAHAQGLVPLPSGVLLAATRLTVDGVIFQAMSGSLQRVLIGFTIGALLGIPLGLAIGTLPALDRALRGVLDTLRSIAPIAWIPMAILWLGVRGDAALFVVAYAAIFPFVVNASHAAELVDRRLVNAARALGASRLLVLRTVLLPGCMPMIFTGARIALAFAWASIVAAELAIGIKIAGQGRSVAGIGQLMVETLYVKRDVDALVFYMLVIGVISLLIDTGLRRLQRRLLPWNVR